MQVYLLEEVVRTVDRLERLGESFHTVATNIAKRCLAFTEAEHEALRQADRKMAHEQAQMSQPEQVMEVEDPPPAGSDEDSEIVTYVLSDRPLICANPCAVGFFSKERATVMRA